MKAVIGHYRCGFCKIQICKSYLDSHVLHVQQPMSAAERITELSDRIENLLDAWRTCSVCTNGQRAGTHLQLWLSYTVMVG